jgi:UDP-glucose 4-epimerase
MADRPVLITGGAGFIGSHLTDALLAKGYSVRILDDLSTGKRSNLPLNNPKVELIVGDVSDAALVARAMTGCSAVAHLAAVASVQASVDDPVKTHQSNFIGSLNVCEAMRQSGVKRVLFASSAAVYGNNGEGESIDEDTPKAPLTPYAVDKLASEQYLDFYRREHGLEPVIFRFFNIFATVSRRGIFSTSRTWSICWCRPSRNHRWKRARSTSVGTRRPVSSKCWQPLRSWLASCQR